MIYYRVSIVLAISVIIMSMVTAQASANEQSDTQIKSMFEEPLHLESIKKESNPLLQEGIKAYTEEEKQLLAYEKRMQFWKKKQESYWDNLPSNVFTINASAYTASADECGKSDGITASGVKVVENRTLACPPEYPFGARIHIEGMGTYTCEDRGGAIKGNHFDIYMETKAEAFAFGRRNLNAYVVQ